MNFISIKVEYSLMQKGETKYNLYDGLLIFSGGKLRHPNEPRGKIVIEYQRILGEYICTSIISSDDRTF